MWDPFQTLQHFVALFWIFSNANLQGLSMVPSMPHILPHCRSSSSPGLASSCPPAALSPGSPPLGTGRDRLPWEFCRTWIRLSCLATGDKRPLPGQGWPGAGSLRKVKVIVIVTVAGSACVCPPRALLCAGCLARLPQLGRAPLLLGPNSRTLRDSSYGATPNTDCALEVLSADTPPGPGAMAWGLLLVLCGGLLAPALAGGPHRLAVLVTAVTNEDRTYHYAMRTQLDDVLVARYSSETREVRPTWAWAAEALGAEYLRQKTKEFWRYEEGSSRDIRRWMHLHNQTSEIHIEQVHVGCALRDQDYIDSHYTCAYDGQDFISFDPQTGTWVAAVQPAFIQKQIWETQRSWTLYIQRFLAEECLGILQNLVQWGKKIVDHQVPPEVSVSRRDAPHGPVTLSCRASGFYPRPIHLSWVRDGGDVLVETSSSGILPLADGTYHTQSSLEIGPRPDGPRYACRVEHSSLPAPALIWAPEKKGSFSPGVLAIIVLLVLVLAGVAGAGVWLWRRKSAGRREPGYAPAATKTGEDSASSSSSGTETQSAGSRS